MIFLYLFGESLSVFMFLKNFYIRDKKLYRKKLTLDILFSAFFYMCFVYII